MLLKYVREVQPALVEQFVEDGPPAVVAAMKNTITNMLGGFSCGSLCRMGRSSCCLGRQHPFHQHTACPLAQSALSPHTAVLHTLTHAPPPKTHTLFPYDACRHAPPSVLHRHHQHGG